MARYWLHRISHCKEVSQSLLEKGFLTIGFSDSGSSEFLRRTLSADGMSQFDDEFQKIWELPKPPKWRYTLWRFLREMKKDDLVLVPGWGDYSVYVIEGDAEPIGNIDVSDLKTWNGEIVEKYHYGQTGRNEMIHALRRVSDKQHIDLGFFRSVKLHRIGCGNGPEAKGISRYNYADQKLTARMKFLGTNVEMSDLEDSLNKSLDAYRRNKPLSLHSRIMEETKGMVLKLIHEELTPDKFESLIKYYFRRIGASNVDIPQRNDPNRKGDADVIATFEPIKVLVYVQAKFHEPGSKTDEWAVEQISNRVGDNSSMQEDGYTKVSWVVSTCDDFTKCCKEMAKKKGVTLINGQEFAGRLIDAGIDGLDAAFSN